ncbi:MAG: HAMP domain-containing sensor histidine kinase, partial [Pseudomonadota bacterium]
AEHTAEVAHELRQPLAIVGGFARRMAKQMNSGGPLDVQKHGQYTQIIIAEIQRLEEILKGLIDFTQRGNIYLQTVNPNDLIRYIVGVTEDRIEEKSLLFALSLGAEIGDIPLDPGRFQQLVLNVLSNAIDACPEGGHVYLETGASIPSDKALRAGNLRADTYFEMKIRYSGPVMPPEELRQVFNPFYHSKEDGLRRGLAGTKKIAEDHGGSISVKSDDKGTAFTVWLPLQQEPAFRTPERAFVAAKS